MRDATTRRASSLALLVCVELQWATKLGAPGSCGLPTSVCAAENFYLFRERRFPCESSIARADLALKGAFFLGVLPGRPLPSPRPSASLLAPFASCFPALEALGVGRPICRSGAFSLGRVLGL